MSDQTPSQPPSHSRAFERLVEGPDDIVGLLAYAKFKDNIRERATTGHQVPAGMRNPSKAEIEAYRGSAERILETYAEHVISDAEPQIAATTRGVLKEEICAYVERRTSLGTMFLMSVGCGILAWLLSIGITILVVYAAPGWVQNLISHVNQDQPAPQQPSTPH